MPKKFKAFSIIMCVAFVLSSFLTGGCNKNKTVEPKTLEATKAPVQPLAEVKVPTQVFAWAVAGNPKSLLANLEVLAGKAGPVPSGFMAQSIDQYLLTMGFKDTSVINLSAPAGVLVLNTMKYPIPFLVAVSTKGEKPMLASLKKEWKQKEEKNGIYHLSRQILDPYSVFKGGQDAVKAKKTEQSIYIKFKGATALISPAPAAIQDAGKVLLERLQDRVPSEGINAALHVDNMKTAFAVQLSMMPQMLKQQIEKSASAVPAGLTINPKGLKWILGWLSDKGFSLLKQTKQLTLSMEVTPRGAVIHTGIIAEPGSFFAKFLSDQKHTKLRLTKGLPENGFLAMGANVQWRQLKKDILEFTQEAMKNFTDEKISKEASSLFDGWFDTMGEEICIVENLAEGGAFEIVEFMEIKDEKKADDITKKMMALMGRIYSSKSGLMGINATVEGPKDAGEVDGVKLSKTVINMDLSSLDPLQAKSIDAIYKDGKMKFMTAVFDKTLALAMGNNCEKTLKDSIERIKKGTGGFTKSAAFVSASGPQGKNTGGFLYISLSRLIYFTATMAGRQNPPAAHKSNSGMFINFSANGRTLFSTLRIPAAHLEEIGEAVKSLAQLSGSPGTVQSQIPQPTSK